jgi:hypothetical protein
VINATTEGVYIYLPDTGAACARAKTHGIGGAPGRPGPNSGLVHAIKPHCNGLIIQIRQGRGSRRPKSKGTGLQQLSSRGVGGAGLHRAAPQALRGQANLGAIQRAANNGTVGFQIGPPGLHEADKIIGGPFEQGKHLDVKICLWRRA